MIETRIKLTIYFPLVEGLQDEILNTMGNIKGVCIECLEEEFLEEEKSILAFIYSENENVLSHKDAYDLVYDTLSTINKDIDIQVYEAVEN